MNLLTYLIIKLIRIYRSLISPLLGDTCRYYPTCSDYSIESLKTFGLLKGLLFKKVRSKALI